MVAEGEESFCNQRRSQPIVNPVLFRDALLEEKCLVSVVFQSLFAVWLLTVFLFFLARGAVDLSYKVTLSFTLPKDCKLFE